MDAHPEELLLLPAGSVGFHSSTIAGLEAVASSCNWIKHPSIKVDLLIRRVCAETLNYSDTMVQQRTKSAMATFTTQAASANALPQALKYIFLSINRATQILHPDCPTW